MASSALRAETPGRLAFPTEIAWWLLVVVLSVGTAAVTMRSVQLGCTVVLVVLAAGLAVPSPRAALVVVWLAWLLTPGLRRVLGPYLAADPLALAPFLMTGAVVLVELSRTRMTRSAWRLVLVAAAGYGLGLATGVAASPPAAAFALVASLVAVGSFVLGYAERGAEAATLRWVLLAALPVVAGYGLLQYVALPQWDRAWLDVTNFVVAGAPEDDRVRVFATLNSPGTFAMVLTLGVLAHLTRRRIGPAGLAGLVPLLAALALTYVRSAWVALVAGLLAFLVAGRGRALGRVALITALLVGGFAVVAAGSPTGEALTGRLTTFGALGQDTSAQERLATPGRIVPVALANPLGAGLGQAGEASRLAEGGGTFRYTDSAYLSLLLQVGPAGFLLVLGVLAAGVRRAWQGVRRGGGPVDQFILAVFALYAVAMVAGDLLFGVTGIVLWYLVGLAVRRGELRAEREQPA